MIAGFVLAVATGLVPARAATSSPRREPRAPAPASTTRVTAGELTAEARAFWERTWSRLAKLDAATRREVNWRRHVTDLTDIAAERRITSLSRSDEDDLFRTRLLVWHLDRLRNRRENLIEPPPAGFAWLSSETWYGALALRPGPARCEALVEALGSAAPADRTVRLATAESLLLEESTTGNVHGAADLALRIDVVEPTADRAARAAWTATQAGRGDAAAAHLVARITASDPADEAQLRLALARVELARGDEIAARAALGAALAGGDARAAALTARLAFDRHEARRARVLLRGWLDAPAPEAEVSALWALAALDSAPYGLRAGPETGPGVPVR